MAVGIKKITESVIEDKRALTYCFPSNDDAAFDTEAKRLDNLAIDTGAIFSSYNSSGAHPFIRIKVGPDSFSKLDAEKTFLDGSITTNLINDGAITNTKIAKNAVYGDAIQDSAITTSKVANENITTSKLANGAVTNTKLAKDSVYGDAIQDGAIKAPKLSESSVIENKIANNAVTTIKIKNSSVTTEKLANSAVTTAKINNSSVTTEKINNGAVVTSKLADDSVTWDKLHDDVVAYIKDAIDKMIKESEARTAALIAEATKHMVQHDGQNNITGADGSSTINNIKIHGNIDCGNAEDTNTGNITATNIIEGRRVYNMTYM